MVETKGSHPDQVKKLEISVIGHWFQFVTNY